MEYYNASDLEEKIRNRFCSPAYAFIPQVRNQTGYQKDIRTCDALAMGLWSSRGLFLNGFEIKVSRNDWLNELKNPEKAEEIAQYCDFWWVVAPRDVVKVDEVPVNWGLMIPFGHTLKVIKKAEQLKTANIDKLFLAAILRRAQESIAPEQKINKAFKEGKDEGEKQANEFFSYERKEHQKLKERIKKFEIASGISIEYEWDIEKIGEVVKQVLDGNHTRAKEQLQSLLQNAENIVEFIKKSLI